MWEAGQKQALEGSSASAEAIYNPGSDTEAVVKMREAVGP